MGKRSSDRIPFSETQVALNEHAEEVAAMELLQGALEGLDDLGAGRVMGEAELEAELARANQADRPYPL